MDSVLQQHSQQIALKTRNWLVAGLGLSLLANVILAGLATGRETEIVLIPAGISGEEYRLHGGVVSKEYLNDMASMAATFLLNVTPGTTEVARARFLRLLHPQSYGKFSTLWDQMVEELRERDISTAFYPLVLRTDQDNLSVEIEGQFITFLGESRSVEPRTYSLKFSTDTGPLLLTAFEEKKGAQK